MRVGSTEGLPITAQQLRHITLCLDEFIPPPSGIRHFAVELEYEGTGDEAGSMLTRRHTVAASDALPSLSSQMPCGAHVLVRSRAVSAAGIPGLWMSAEVIIDCTSPRGIAIGFPGAVQDADLVWCIPEGGALRAKWDFEEPESSITGYAPRTVHATSLGQVWGTSGIDYGQLMDRSRIGL